MELYNIEYQIVMVLYSKWVGRKVGRKATRVLGRKIGRSTVEIADLRSDKNGGNCIGK